MTAWILLVSSIDTSSTRAQAGRGAGQRPDGKRPTSYGLTAPRAGPHLWAAGYVPAGGRCADGSDSSPLDRRSSRRDQTASTPLRPIPPPGHVDETPLR